MDIQEIARNTFTIAALLLTAAIILLSYSWKRLKTLIKTMPEGKQRIAFNLRSISDPAERDKCGYIVIQLFACVFFIMSFGGALIAVSEMSGVMVGDIGGIYAAENFEFAVVAMRVAVVCLDIGVFCLAMVYFEDLLALCTGKPSIATAKLEELPERSPRDKAWSYISFGLVVAFIVVLFLIEVFVPFNQWVKMTIALVTGVVLLFGVRFGYRVYVRIRSRHVPTTRQ